MAIDAVRPAAEAKSIRIATAFDAPAGVLRGDPTRLQQVVWNLLSNAVKFTANGGEIRVRLEHHGAGARLTVSDNGCGISEDFLPFIFDRFSQAERHMTRKHGGLGLGLAIVRHLVEMHGGSIHVESPGEGQGASFTVDLPMSFGHLEAADESEPAARRVETPHRLKDLRILLVDDDPDTLQMLTMTLEMAGGEVRACASASEALAALGEWKADLLISDIGMPNEDGYVLIRKVRATGMGVVIVTHFIEQVYAISDRITVLRDGRLVGEYETANLPRGELVAKMMGRELAQFETESRVGDEAPHDRGRPVVSVREKRCSSAPTVRHVTTNSSPESASPRSLRRPSSAFATGSWAATITSVFTKKMTPMPASLTEACSFA